MDQRRHRRRTFHRVRQPDVQRNLRRLTRRADKEQQRRDRHDAHAERLGRAPRRGLGHALEVQRAEGHENQQHPQDEAEVADAVDDKRLLAGVRCRLLRVIEANQQVRTEADALPADEHQREAGAEHEHEHEGGEEIQIGEVARVFAVGLLVHVSDRIDVNQRSDAGDDHQHQRRELIQAQREWHLQRPGRYPVEDDLFDRMRVIAAMAKEERPCRSQRHEKRGNHHDAGNAAGNGLRQPPPERGVDEEAREGQERNQEQHVTT